MQPRHCIHGQSIDFFLHLMKNFVKMFQGTAYACMYPVARFQIEYREYLINKIYVASAIVNPYLGKHYSLLWIRIRASSVHRSSVTMLLVMLQRFCMNG